MDQLPISINQHYLNLRKLNNFAKCRSITLKFHHQFTNFLATTLFHLISFKSLNN